MSFDQELVSAELERLLKEASPADWAVYMLGNPDFFREFQVQILTGIGSGLRDGERLKWKNLRFSRDRQTSPDGVENTYVSLEVRGGAGRIILREIAEDNHFHSPEIVFEDSDGLQEVFAMKPDGSGWVSLHAGLQAATQLRGTYPELMEQFGAFFQNIAHPLDKPVLRSGLRGYFGATKLQKQTPTIHNIVTAIGSRLRDNLSDATPIS